MRDSNHGRGDAPVQPGISLDRRALLRGAAGLTAGIAGARLLGASGVLASPTGVGPGLLRARMSLPAGAAPEDKQILIVPSDPTTTSVMDFYENVYKRPSYAADLFSDPLVRVDKNFKIVPAAATEWAVGADGVTWTFKLDPKLVWSDGAAVTANDWVATFQYAADPKHAWDFTWFWQGVIKGWDSAITGKVPLTDVGVRQGADAQTLIIETQAPAPYLPAMLLYSLPLSAAALLKHGPLYNNKPETAVSSGPFILNEWIQDQHIVYTRNASYRGTLDVAIQKVIVKLADFSTHFTMYQSDEIDLMEGLTPAQQKIATDLFPKDVHSSVGDFRTFYVYFDVTKKPFDDPKVRQAWSHAIDRDVIASKVLGPMGSPAYSWLAPGFPGSDREGFKGIQAFEPAKAKQLLTETGYPDGDGFPKQQMWLRAPTPLDKAVSGAFAAMIKQNLNIDVELLEKDQTGYMAALTAKPTEILLGYVSYGMDFLDPTNMLGVWLSGGRHSWSNPTFDAKVKEASSFLGSTEERLKLFHEAEQTLVEDVPAVFVYHETPLQLVKPWLQGDAIEPDATGNTSIHWPRYTSMSTVPGGLHVADTVPGDHGKL